MSGNNFNGALNPAYSPDELENNHKNAHEAGTQPRAADDTIVDIADVSKYGKTIFRTFKAALLQNILKQSLVTNISKYLFKYI